MTLKQSDEMRGVIDDIEVPGMVKLVERWSHNRILVDEMGNDARVVRAYVPTRVKASFDASLDSEKRRERVCSSIQGDILRLAPVLEGGVLAYHVSYADKAFSSESDTFSDVDRPTYGFTILFFQIKGVRK